MNSLPRPSPDCTVLNANRMCMPVNQPRNPTPMNSPILTLFTGTPTARDDGAEPPTENDDANTACADLKPSMLDTSLVPTLPVIILVMARFRPRSMRAVVGQLG